jgi:hypothetical protein
MVGKKYWWSRGHPFQPGLAGLFFNKHSMDEDLQYARHAVAVRGDVVSLRARCLSLTSCIVVLDCLLYTTKWLDFIEDMRVDGLTQEKWLG